jgi:hypothetical protein
MTTDELAITRALLPKNDARTNRLIMQAEEAPWIERRLLSQSAYQLWIPYVRNAKTIIDTSVEVISPELQISDKVSMRGLTFTIKVLRGGFLNALTGTIRDGGPWPKSFTVSSEGLAKFSQKLSNWLPLEISDAKRLETLIELIRWCAGDSSILSGLVERDIRVYFPASDEDIHECQARLRIELPAEYLEFVRISNGLSLSRDVTCDILGTRDIYLLEMGTEGEQSVVIESLYEDGVIAIECGTKNNGMLIAVTPGNIRRRVLGNFRAHVRSRLLGVEII